MAEYYIAFNLMTRGLLDSSLKIADRELKTLRYTGDDREAYVDLSLLKARALNNSNQPKEALHVIYPLLGQAEKEEDSLTSIAAISSLIGAYITLSQDRQALDWGYKALRLFPRAGPKTAAFYTYTGSILTNCCLCYLHLYENEGSRVLRDSATYFSARAIERNREFGSVSGLAYNLGLKGTLLGYADQRAEGEATLKESLDLYRQIGNTFYILNTMSIMGNFYRSTHQPEKGIAICKEGIALSKRYKPNFFLYDNLADNYKMAGDYRGYAETLKELQVLKDSMYTVNSAEALSDLRAKYEVQTRENIIIRQKLDLTRKNYLLYGSLGLLFILLITGYIVLAIRKKNQAMKLQDLQVEEKRKTLQAVLQAEENERKRIAADLHDGVAQKMVVAKMNLQTFESYFPGFNTEQQHVFDNITALVDESCTEVRDLSHSMMPQAFFRSGLTEAVKNLLNKIGDKKLVVKFNAVGSLENVPENTQIMIYRIMQECIQNVLKHAKASTLDISIIAEQGELDITVEDNGVGFDAGAGGDPAGVGLSNIRSRVAFLNGQLDISSRPGAGTLMAFYIPLTDGKNETLK